MHIYIPVIRIGIIPKRTTNNHFMCCDLQLFNFSSCVLSIHVLLNSFTHKTFYKIFIISRVLSECMKDEITIGLNGKTIASFGIELKGRSINVKSIGRFVVSTGSDEGNDVMNIRMGCILETLVEEKKVAPIEPMVVQPIFVEKKSSVDEWAGSLNPDKLPTPVQQQMEAVSTPVPKHIEIPIKTGRKPRGPNKAKEVVEESVFDKPVEVETVVERPVVEEKDPVVAPVKLPVVSTSTTPARINELAKLVKMWSKASGLGIDYITADRLKAEAFDIVENDSDETIVAGIEEAKRLIKG